MTSKHLCQIKIKFFLIGKCQIFIYKTDPNQMSNTNLLSRILRNIKNGLFFIFVMLFYFKSILFITTTLFFCDLFIWNKRIKNFIVQFNKRAWLHLTMAALYIYFPNPIFINYDPRVLEKMKNIVISNHVSEYDWVLILTLLYHLNRYDDVCIILKQSLRNVPLIGYGMKCFGFIFLNRKLSEDKIILNEGVSRLIDQKKYNLLLFPEGTYIDSTSYPKSCEFAIKNEIKANGKRFLPKNVLIPRISGFNILKEKIIDDIDGVIDITMVMAPLVHFPQEEYTYADTILKFKGRIHCGFYIDFISDKKKINDSNFLFDTFKAKDDLLEKYKNLYDKEIFKDLKDFKTKTSNIRPTRHNYEYKIIDLRTKWDVFFYMTFVLTEILFGYYSYKFIRRFI